VAHAMSRCATGDEQVQKALASFCHSLVEVFSALERPPLMAPLGSSRLSLPEKFRLGLTFLKLLMLGT